MLQSQTLLLQRNGWLLRLHMCPPCHKTAQHALPWVCLCISALKEITHPVCFLWHIMQQQTFHLRIRATGPAVKKSCFDLQKEMGVNGARKSCFTWNSNKQFVSHKKKLLTAWISQLHLYRCTQLDVSLLLNGLQIRNTNWRRHEILYSCKALAGSNTFQMKAMVQSIHRLHNKWNRNLSDEWYENAVIKCVLAKQCFLPGALH